MSNCCLVKHLHEGKPKGSLETVCGLETYVVGTKSSKVVVICTDVYGHRFQNVQLIGDLLADAGYYVLIPDIVKGDPAPDEAPAGYDLMRDWLPYHGADVTAPIVDKFFEDLQKEHAPQFVGVVGYCWGAKYAIQQLNKGTVNVGAVAHPTMVTIEEIRGIGSRPLFIGAAEVDPVYTVELRHEAEAALKDIKATYSQVLFSGVVHGFAVKGDLSDPTVKWSKEKVFSDMVAWFKRFSA